MDHNHYDYVPLSARNPARWPGGASLAAFVTVYVEHWELVAPTDAHRDTRFVGEYGSFFPDFRTWTQREYGNRVGLYRVLDALDEAGIVPAFAVNARACALYPRIIEEIRRRPGEVLAHGLAATRMLTSKMSEQVERETIADARARIEQAMGVAPRGWVGQDYGESHRTPQLLAEAGVRYVLDWPNDDMPYWFANPAPLVSLPNQAEWDDVQCQWLRRVPVTRYPSLVSAAFERLRTEGVGRVFGLGIHPWLSGMSSRIRYLREALAAIRASDGVWWAQPGAIADAFADAHPHIKPPA